MLKLGNGNLKILDPFFGKFCGKFRPAFISPLRPYIRR